MAYAMAIASDLVRVEVIDAEEFRETAIRHRVGPVPKIMINYQTEFIGAAPESYFLEKLLSAP